MDKVPKTDPNDIFRRFAVERWLEENLNIGASNCIATLDESMVARILQEGPKAIRAILKEPRWGNRKNDGGVLYTSLQNALKSVAQESNDPLYHAPWQEENFTNTPLEVGEEQFSTEQSMEHVGPIDHAVDSFKELLMQLSDAQVTPEFVERSFQLFKDECIRLNPNYIFRFDLTEARRRLLRGDPTPLKVLIFEFNEQICYPSNRVYTPITIGPNELLVEYYDASIYGHWRKHVTPTGQIGFSASVSRKRGRNDNCVQSAMTMGNRFFLEDAELRVDSDDHYKMIQTSTEQNPCWYALRSYFRARNINADQYFQFLEQFRIIFEEREHLYDQSCIELYKEQHPNKEQYAATTDVLIASRGGSLTNLWKQKQNTDFKYIMENITTEFVGQLGGLIHNMQAFIKRGEMAMAFAAFLNYLGLMCDSTSLKQEIVMRCDDKQQAEDKIANIPNGAYMFVGEILIHDLDSSGSTFNILSRCQPGSDEHPAHVALRLLEEVYAKNSHSLEERKKLLNIE